MTRDREDVVGLDATINQVHLAIWKASGHVDTFSDPMVDCLVTQKRFRADHVELQSGVVYRWKGAKDASGKTSDDHFSALLAGGKPPESARKVGVQFYTLRGLTNPELLEETTEKVENSRGFNPENGAQLTDPVPFNLMFKTYIGATATEEDKAYLRPETAQAIFAQFKNVVDSSRQKVPFGICQIGKAFRNEVTPRNFTFRSREFEQMELEFFIKPDEAIEAACGSVAAWHDGADLSKPQDNWGWEMWHRYWVKERTDYYAGIGLGADVLDYHWQTKDELAHYAWACVDILFFAFPFGTEELEGIAARGDFDLMAHQTASKKPQDVFDEEVKNAFAKWTDEQRAALVDPQEGGAARQGKGRPDRCASRRVVPKALQGLLRAARHRAFGGSGSPRVGGDCERIYGGREDGRQGQQGNPHGDAFPSTHFASQGGRVSVTQKQAGAGREGP